MRPLKSRRQAAGHRTKKSGTSAAKHSPGRHDHIPTTTEPSAPLTRDQLHKAQTLLTSGNAPAVTLAVDLLRSLHAAEDGWSGAFSSRVISRLVNTWNAAVWEATASGLADHPRLLEEFADVAAERFSKLSGPKRTAFLLAALAELTECLQPVIDFCLEKDTDYLDLGELKTLSNAAAASAGKGKWCLRLSGLTTLSDVAAEGLCRVRGPLDLNGLTTLSEAAALSLSEHRGELELNGITQLSDTAARHLSEHKSDVSVSGLTELSDNPGHLALVSRLCRTKHALRLNINSLSPAAACILAKCKTNLFLDEIKSLSDVAAQCLGKYKGEWLSLDNLETLSDVAADYLSRGKGYLSLYSLRTISDSVAASLSQRAGRLGLGGLRCLTDRAAECLGKHSGGLTLWGLTSLSDEAVESLSHTTGDLHLDGLTTLSDLAAVSLSRHKGELGLNGLTTLSDCAAKSLCKHAGNLGLRGLTSLQDKAAEYLGAFRYELLNVSPAVLKRISAARRRKHK